MSSFVRTIQTPNFSFHRSSTPAPYSLGNPALNCCGGSLRTLGNMKRPVAASAAADAAVNAPQATPIQARRVRSGERSSGSRVAAAAGFTRGRGLHGGGASGRCDGRRLAGQIRNRRGWRSGCDGTRRMGCGSGCRRGRRLRPQRRPAHPVSGSSDMVVASQSVFFHKLPHGFQRLERACRTFRLRSCWLSPSIEGRRLASFSAAAARKPLIITSAIGSRSSA